MKRKIVHFTWEDEDAQQVFAEWLPFPDAQTSAKEVDEIEKFVGLKSPLFVLDVGCGNGRHSLELGKRGNRVVGIDVASLFLEEAQKAALNAGVPVDFRLQRASELPEKNVFDLALAYWHTIGFMSDDEIKKTFFNCLRFFKTWRHFLLYISGTQINSWPGI